MTALQVYCAACGGRWEILDRDEFTNKRYAECPHCGKQIDDQTYELFVLPAFAGMIDANCQLIRDSIDKHECGFTISVKSTLPRDPDSKRMRTSNRRSR